ncbi:hypothetical protein ACMA1I_12050 [Pontibacter sp. 13R65]|uniref:hypothetical protein n=1 Tax=Pontibacter sp. 13R65 TaxID=3127458 RepID=UPI00301DC531
MRNYLKNIYLLFFSLVLFACSDSCDDIDCLTEEFISFSVRSGENGNDLIFGRDPQITNAEIEAFYFEDGSRERIPIRFESEKAVLPLVPNVSVYYVEALGQRDQIEVKATANSSSECCPATTAIEGVMVNGVEVSDFRSNLILYR